LASVRRWGVSGVEIEEVTATEEEEVRRIDWRGTGGKNEKRKPKDP